jgi:hypothetical protein
MNVKEELDKINNNLWREYAPEEKEFYKNHIKSLEKIITDIVGMVEKNCNGCEYISCLHSDGKTKVGYCVVKEIKQNIENIIKGVE